MTQLIANALAAFVGGIIGGYLIAKFQEWRRK